MDRKDPEQLSEAFIRFNRRYRADAEIRARIARGDTSDIDRSEMDIPDGMDLRIVEQAADTFYFFLLPPVPNQALSDESLGSMAGGSCHPGHGPGHHHGHGSLFQSSYPGAPARMV